MFPNWDWTLIAIAASFHGAAILSTLFRLWYRWYTARMWWDDAWAFLALLADVACLAAAVIERPIPGDALPRFFFPGLWVVSIAYTILIWATRISILTSLVHVSQPEGMLRRLTLGVGALFAMMCVLMIALRLRLCILCECLMDNEVLISQTVTDCIADVLLTAFPIWALHDMNLRRNYKILILTTFSASMVINIVTVIQAVALFKVLTSGSPIFEHVKVACSMIVCNLLVIVTFVYRILRNGNTDLEGRVCNRTECEFTTVDLSVVLSEEASKVKSVSAPSGKTKSSTWSFRSGRQTNASASVTAATSWMGSMNLSRVRE